MSEARDPFFVGWSAPPRGTRLFLLAVAAVFVAAFAASAYVVAATQSDPGDGAFRWDLGQRSVTGVLQANPYPVVHVTESDLFPPGTTLMLSGNGKRGVRDRGAALDGHEVTATGILLTRGDLAMLQVGDGTEGLGPVDANAEETESGDPSLVPPPVPLGRYRLTGEICDGKCYAGAMRPGTGLAHKACANLCLTGGVPPVFVATGAVDGERFFLMGAADGGPLPDTILDHTAVLVEAEGTIERRGDLAVFLVDTDTIGLAQ